MIDESPLQLFVTHNRKALEHDDALIAMGLISYQPG